MSINPNSNCTRSILVAAVCLFLANTAAADDSQNKKRLTFETLRAHALSQSPLVARIDATFANKVGAAIETGLLNNPQVQAGVTYPESYSDQRPDDRFSLNLSQPLRPSDFGTRSAVETLLRKAASQQQRFELLSLSQDILLQYINLWALKERRRFVEKMRTIASEKASLAAKGNRKGFLDTSEAKLLQGAAARLKLLELGLKADISNTEAVLTNSTTFVFSNNELERPGFIDVPPLEEALVRSRENELGQRKRMELLERLAIRQVDLAKKDSFPTFTPSLLFEHEDNADFIGLGVTFELPFFNRNQGEVLRKKQKSRAVTTQKDYLDGSAFQAELEATLRAASLRHTQAAMYEREVFPLFREALHSAEKQFESGQTSVLQLWQSFMSLNDANEELLLLWVKAYRTRSKLSLMLGEQ